MRDHVMDAKSAPTVVIIGLGYVGLTLSVALARRGVQVYGIEKRPEVVEKTNAGIPHFAEIGLQAALADVVKKGRFVASTTTKDVPTASYYIITVGTPLFPQSYEPRLDMIEEASREVAEHFTDGATVILRSTVRIGTTTGVVKPILDRTGKAYHLAMCPERTLEGDAMRELITLPQIIGGETPEASDNAAALFSRLTHTIVRVASPETAEMIKLVDNTSRDVHFAFANEVARACDALGINANDVIRYGKLGYARTNVAAPGLVGGPCLEKDPHILLSSVTGQGISLEITAASRLVNERQPAETVASLVQRLQARRSGPYKAVVAGLAFKGRPETDDLRGSMSLHVIREMMATEHFSEIRVYDGVVPMDHIRAISSGITPYETLTAACEGADVLVIANNHPEYSKIDLEAIVGTMSADAFVYDYWNNLSEMPAEVLENRYVTVGNLVGKFQ
ncbi:nucleotide sugar dehydrogenase [Methylorubrum populi]